MGTGEKMDGKTLMTKLANAREEGYRAGRLEALEEAAKICDGNTISVRFKSWPCWNPNGNIEKNSDAARLAFCLAFEIRALGGTK